MFLITNKRRLFTSDQTEIIRWACSEKAGDVLKFAEYNIDNKQFMLIPEMQNEAELSFTETSVKANTTLKSSECFFNKIYIELKNIFIRK
jgi:hypothetical protein